jgi:recombination protein RecA
MTEDHLNALIKSLKKQDLEASTLADDAAACVVSEFIHTGSYVLDAIMGGGLPKGRIVEIYGDTSTGKSLIAAQACASIQRAGGIAVYIDTETAVSTHIMRAVGVDVDKLVYTAPGTVEDVFATIEDILANEEIKDCDILVVWDSIAATSSKAEREKATGETGYLTQSRTISQGLRKNAGIISKRKMAVLLLNQTRTKIGVLFGDKVATFGGMAPAFYASIRVELSSHKPIQDEDKREIGIHIKAKVKKNKIAKPFLEAEFPVYFGHGIHDYESIFDFLKEYKVIEYSGGGWYKYGESKVKASEWDTFCAEHYAEVCADVDAALQANSF